MSFRHVSLRTGALLIVAGALLVVGAAILVLAPFSSSQTGTPEPNSTSSGNTRLSDDSVDEQPASVPGARSIGRIMGRHVLEAEVPRRMIIESTGVEAPVVPFGLDEDGAPEVPLNGSDVAWYYVFASPGRGSNAIFSGHVDWARAPAVFSDLKDLEAGDTIVLVMQDGTKLVYAVSDNFSVDPADPASAQVMAPTPTDTITLITCGGTWIPDGDREFGGDYSDRVIVQATRVSTNTSRIGSSGGF